MMQIKKLLTRVGPILVLYVLSPIIAELLSASTPASRSEQLLFQSLFYGSAALLIREFSIRFKLGWLSIILLGLAFGIIEECLLLQSAFNPHFLNFDISFGRFWGVNWIWSEVIIPYHAIWSITVPILLSELIFPRRKKQQWLSKSGIILFSILYLLSSLAFYLIFYNMSSFTASWIHYVVAGLLTIGIILIAFKLPNELLVKYRFKTPQTWVLFIISLMVSLFWVYLLSLVFKQEPIVPAWVVGLSGLIVPIILLLFILGWTNSKWNDIHRFSLGCGVLYAGMISGLGIVLGSKNKLDIIFHITFIVISSVLLEILRRRINITSSQPMIDIESQWVDL